MPPKKILFVITKANWGGAQKYVYELAIAAQGAGHDVMVAYGEEGHLTKMLDQQGIRHVRLPHMRNAASLSALREAERALFDLYIRERPDIVHLNSTLASAAGARAAQRANIAKIIFTAHGWAFNEARPLWQRLVIRYFAKRTVRDANTTICVSEAVRRDIESSSNRHKLTLIYNGIRPSPLLPRDEAREKLDPKVGGFWVGMLSELHPTKRVEDAIRAMAGLDAHLFVLGEGQERAKLEDLVRKLGLEERVHLLGFVSDAPRHLAAFDLFLHTSRSEALSLAILEAGATGLPVVATRVGGIPEVIEHEVHGLLIPPFSPQRAREAIGEIMQDPEKAKRLGAALKERVLRGFSLEKMVRETLALYH